MIKNSGKTEKYPSPAAWSSTATTCLDVAEQVVSMGSQHKKVEQ